MFFTVYAVFTRCKSKSWS